MRLWLTGLFVVLMLAATSAWAQTKAKAATKAGAPARATAAAPAGDDGVDVGGTRYKKKTVYDFDDDVVEGDLMRPDGELVAIKRKAKHSSLIKIREHFIPEMLKSAEDL